MSLYGSRWRRARLRFLHKHPVYFYCAGRGDVTLATAFARFARTSPSGHTTCIRAPSIQRGGRGLFYAKFVPKHRTG